MKWLLSFLIIGVLLFPSVSFAASISVTGTAAVTNTGNTLDFTDSYNSNVMLDESTGVFSGFAWSKDIGWIDFGNNGGDPVTMDITTGAVTGEAYVVNSSSVLSFNSTFNSNVTVDLSAGTFSGYAWSTDLGWINFANVTTTFSPTPTSSVSTVTLTPTPAAPTALSVKKIGTIDFVDGVYTYYYSTGENLTITGNTDPYTHVVLTIHSDPITCETDADSDGNFSCTFASTIATGAHTLSITSQFAGGTVKTYPEISLGIKIGLAETGQPAAVPFAAGAALLFSLLPLGFAVKLY